MSYKEEVEEFTRRVLPFLWIRPLRYTGANGNAPLEYWYLIFSSQTVFKAFEKDLTVFYHELQYNNADDGANVYVYLYTGFREVTLRGPEYRHTQPYTMISLREYNPLEQWMERNRPEVWGIEPEWTAYCVMRETGEWKVPGEGKVDKPEWISQSTMRKLMNL